jgi:hypothetical protein
MALLLPACSAIRLGYGNADSLARWWMDQYLDLYAGAGRAGTRAPAPPDGLASQDAIAGLCGSTRPGTKPGVGKPTAADGLELTEAIIRRVRRLADRAIPDAADLLLTLTPAQIERMAARMADKNLSYAKEARLAEGEAGQRKARFKRLLERAEYWYGAFSDGQEAAIRQLIDARPSGPSSGTTNACGARTNGWTWRARYKAEKPSRERVMALLRDYADRFDMPADPSRRATATRPAKGSSELAAAIQALTTRRNVTARSKFDDLIREIGELAQEA